MLVRLARSAVRYTKVRGLRLVERFVLHPFQKLYGTNRNAARNEGKEFRALEIGPGEKRILGFETLNVAGGFHIDYVADAGKKLPFRDASFDLIYASHVLEHLPWYQSGDILKEWYRVLKSGGEIEVWVPDGLKIAQAFVEAEDKGGDAYKNDGWWRFNPNKDPCVWMSGRTFSYGDGKGTPSDPNWHRSLFSERHLRNLLQECGFTDVRAMQRSQVRGHDHGWINLGLKARKP